MSADLNETHGAARAAGHEDPRPAPAPRRRRWPRIAGWAAAGIIGLVALALAASFLPIGDPDTSSHPDPARSYDEAVSRIRTVQAAEAKLPLQPITHSVALLHGSQVETAVVIYHGYTHSPYQWRVVSKALYDQGYNVWIPLMPFHGYADRMTDAPSGLTAEVTRDFADRAVDVGAGLGRHVEVVGLSNGGVLAAWAAAERKDVSRSIAIAPVFAPATVPDWATMPLVRLIRWLPFDVYNWWDQKTKEDNPGPAYPRFSFKGVAALIDVGQRVIRHEETTPQPAAGSVELVANWGDSQVNVAYNIGIIKAIGPPERVSIFEIPASAGFGHDLVEPDGQNKAVIRDVYPVLARALGVALPDPTLPGSALATSGAIPGSVPAK